MTQADATVTNVVRMRTQATDFVRTWQTSSTRKEVAAKLGITYGAVISREKAFRKKNIPLKVLSSVQNRGGRINVEELTALCEESLPS